MKKGLFWVFATLLLACFTLSLSAQEKTALSGNNEDSIICHQNTLQYVYYLENRDIDTAVVFWRRVLAGCPASSEDIYTSGELIYTGLYETTGERAYIDSILIILSRRSFYFGDRPSNELHKAMVLFDLGKSDTSYTEQCYSILNNVSDSFPAIFGNRHTVLTMAVASRLYSFGVMDTTAVLGVYLNSAEAIENNDVAIAEDISDEQAEARIDSIFVSSGAMTCNGRVKIYERKVNRKPGDIKLITEVYNILTAASCTGSDFYYSLATRIFASDRSAKNAVRLAELNLARRNTDKAISYFTTAYKADTNKIVQSEVLTRVALMMLDAGKKQEARNYAEHAYELNNKNGKAVFIMAEACAGSNIGDAFENHATYWVAVDYLKDAMSIDPSLKEEATKKIIEYSKLFPTREEGFYKRITDEGVIYRVGGWINEVTVIRFRLE